MNPTIEQDAPDLISLLQQTAIFLWKDWPRDMKLAALSGDGNSFKMWGECPHCSPVKSAFETVTNTFEANIVYGHPHLIAVARCIACRQFILAAIQNTSQGWGYAFHYPLGQPNDKVDKDIPEHIASDFSEALKCQWVNAHQATAEMCRRTVESSCINLGAPYNAVLQKMIDWLEAQKIITPALRNVAHQIRLGGDRAAHPPEDPAVPAKYEPMTKIEKEHADAIVEYTRHFLEHVYVIPKRLPTFDFSKPKKKS